MSSGCGSHIPYGFRCWSYSWTKPNAGAALLHKNKILDIHLLAGYCKGCKKKSPPMKKLDQIKTKFIFQFHFQCLCFVRFRFLPLVFIIRMFSNMHPMVLLGYISSVFCLLPAKGKRKVLLGVAKTTRGEPEHRLLSTNANISPECHLNSSTYCSPSSLNASSLVNSYFCL